MRGKSCAAGAADPYASGSGEAFSFIPNENGSYQVSLTVTRDTGATSTITRTVEVTSQDSTPPVVTVDTLLTRNNRPVLSGTVTDIAPSSGIAGVTVVVGGQALTATISGSTWSVAVPNALARPGPTTSWRRPGMQPAIWARTPPAANCWWTRPGRAVG